MDKLRPLAHEIAGAWSVAQRSTTGQKVRAASPYLADLLDRLNIESIRAITRPRFDGADSIILDAVRGTPYMTPEQVEADERLREED